MQTCARCRAGDQSELENERGLIGGLKYRLYLFVLLICLLGVFVSWAVENNSGTLGFFDGATDISAIILCAALSAVLFWKKQRAVWGIELLGYSVAASYFLFNTYYVVWVEYGRDGKLGKLVELSTWPPMV